MTAGGATMRAWDYPHATVVVRCTECKREGRYSKSRFLELVGRDTSLPKALGIIAGDCPRANKPADVLHDRCRAYFPDLSSD